MNYRQILILILFLSLLPSGSWAKRYRQPAYITNAYFTNRLIPEDDYLRPEYVINVLRAEHKASKGHFVLELIVDKGTHILSVDLLDKSGKKFDGHDFPETVADKHDFSISVNLTYGGDLPAGGIFFKVYDRYNGSNKVELGTFRISSETWE